MTESGVCGLCADAILLGWLGQKPEKVEEDAQSNKELAEQIAAVVRVLCNPETASHVMAMIGKIREIGKFIEVRYSMLSAHQMKKLVKKYGYEKIP